MRLAPLLLAVLAVLAVAAPAGAAMTEATYQLTFRAEMKEEWDFREWTSSECQVGTCTSEWKGRGTASIQLGTRRAEKVTVRRMPGQRPWIDTGVDRGLPLTGPYLRTGELVKTYDGWWKAANPDEVADASRCGNRTIKADLSFGWHARNQLMPTVLVDDLREGCPATPPLGTSWPGDGPSLFGLVAQTAESKFGRVKQFTVRGSKTWVADVDGVEQPWFSRRASHDVKWTWEATFRMLKPKKKRRR